jgi:hypothetical protein
LDFPAHGQVRTSNELRKTGVFVSPSGVRSIWLRHGLACFKDRLKALEDKVRDLASAQKTMQRQRLSAHAGEDHDVLAARHALYTRARAANPRRWSGTTRDWTPRGAVTLNPERDAVIDAAIVSQDKQAGTA